MEILSLQRAEIFFDNGDGYFETNSTLSSFPSAEKSVEDPF